MMIVGSPKVTPMVLKVAASAMPVTTPGRAIGSTSRNEIVSRPKNLWRCNANAASVPSTRAMAVAPGAAASEVPSAPRTLPLANASPNQRRERPVGGHTCERLGVKSENAPNEHRRQMRARGVECVDRDDQQRQVDERQRQAAEDPQRHAYPARLDHHTPRYSDSKA